MVDPSDITNYNLTIPELEEHLLFWVLAAGKNGTTAARLLDKLLKTLHHVEGARPFMTIGTRMYDDMYYDMFSVNIDPFGGYKYFTDVMKECGIGCYNNKSRTIHELVNSNLDLKTCTAEQLESIYGIGMKTSRCFIIHSRPNAQYAGLDTHALKFLRSKGHEAPKSTPSSKKKYLELEKIFLTYVKESGMMVPEFDLKIWNKYKVASKEA